MVNSWEHHRLPRQSRMKHFAVVMKLCLRFAALMSLAFVASCGKNSPAESPNAPISPQPTQQVFQVKGTITQLQPAEKSVRIRHETIPGYMDAMAMTFDVKDTNELAGLAAGDTVAFRLTVTDKDGWVDQIKKLSAPPRTNTLPTIGPFRFVRDVEPLSVGDALPDS